MTVRELIAALERMPRNDRVVVRDVEGDLVEVEDVQALTLRTEHWGDEPVVYVSGS